MSALEELAVCRFSGTRLATNIAPGTDQAAFGGLMGGGFVNRSGKKCQKCRKVDPEGPLLARKVVTLCTFGDILCPEITSFRLKKIDQKLIVLDLKNGHFSRLCDDLEGPENGHILYFSRQTGPGTPLCRPKTGHFFDQKKMLENGHFFKVLGRSPGPGKHVISIG